jgi:PAS domain S-box-containing protein
MTMLSPEINKDATLRTGWRRVIWGLVFLAWVVVLYGVGHWAEQRELGVLQQQAQRNLEVQSLSLRGIAERYKHIPYVAGRQQDVRALLAATDDKSAQGRVDVYLQDVNRRAGAEALYLMDVQGNCIAASNWHLGSAGSFKNEIYGYRAYFKRALARGWGVDYAVGSTTGSPGLFYASPVQTGDTRHGVMAIKVNLKEIENSWIEAVNPIFLLDQRGIVILGSLKEHLYKTTRALTIAELDELHFKKGQYGREPSGQNKIFQPTPWTLVVVDGLPFKTIRIIVDGRDREFLVMQEHLTDYDWTLIVTEDLAPARIARWIAITIAALSSLALLLGGISWRQRGLRVVELREYQEQLESRVADRTRELAAGNAFLRAMENSLPVGIRVMDKDGIITAVNAKMCEITGYEKPELEGRPIPHPHWHPDETEEHQRNIRIALEGNAAATGHEQRFRHKSGRDIQMMIYTAPLVVSGELRGYISSMVDITRQKEFERQESNLLATSVLVNMGEMVFTLTHELGSPFLSISGAAEAASRHLESGNHKLLKQALSNILQQTQRAREIIQSIRTRSPKKAPTFSTCAVNDVVANVMKLFKAELKHKKTRLVMQLQEQMPSVMADRIQLEQVILNFLLNAMQAMADTPARERVVRVDTGTVENEVFIRVTDHGTGISPEVANQLFNLFFTTKKNGLGVGLKFCKTTIEEHSGRLTYSALATGGTIFSIHLPIAL